MQTRQRKAFRLNHLIVRYVRYLKIRIVISFSNVDYQGYPAARDRG